MATGHAEAKWIQVQLDRTQVEPVSPKYNSVFDGTALIHIGFLVSWMLVVFTYLSLSKTSREAARDAKFKLLHAHKVPCQQCQFYTNNPYLKCAVRPTTAMTKQAADCSDYQTQQLPSTVGRNTAAQDQMLGE